jgi:preprotein translocase subunit SecE
VRKVTNYLKEVRLELKKVVWPERAEVIQMTLIVIITSAIVALYVGGLDVMFTKLLEQAISQ